MAVTIGQGRVNLRSLEFFLTDRCNLRCSNCSASSPYLHDKNLADLDLFRRSLMTLQGVLASDQLKLLGGEPLLNRQICEFMEVATASGLFKRIRVVTNGILLATMTDRFWELVDVVEVSLYSSAAKAPSESDIAALVEHAERFGTRLEVNRIDRFMLPFSESRMPEPVQVERVFQTCGEAHAWSCHLLYQGRLYRCSRVHTLDRYLTEIGVPHESFTNLDGLDILNKSRRQLREEILAYLNSERPLAACSFCLGTSGRWEECRQLTPEEIRSKREASREPFRDDMLVPRTEANMRGRTLSWDQARTKRFL